MAENTALDVNQESLNVDIKVINLIPEDMARRRCLMPLSISRSMLTVAMVDPGDLFSLEDMRLHAGMAINPVYADKRTILKAINKYYRGAYLLEKTARAVSQTNFGLITGDRIPGGKLAQLTEQPPLVQLVDDIILEALHADASDIHIEPERDSTRVRYRVDGFLHTFSSLPKHLAVPVVSRIKILAEMDVTEKHEPQDGQIIRMIGDEEVNLRVATFPTTNGEKVAIRIIGKGASSIALNSSGLTEANFALVKRLIARPSGLVLACGPTGCGKTSTLYSILSLMNSDKVNIVTLEDPIEFDLPGVNQAKVLPKRGLTFARGLRAILRQDPNVVMVGEIRDLETADLAIRASLTGHMVLSTLHTNDALGVITRLIDMGFDEFLISSALSGVIAQRLVRTICPNCRTEYTPTPEILESVGIVSSGGPTFYHGAGCEDCQHTGYKGRTGIYEVIYVNEALRQMILRKAPEPDIRQALRDSGYASMLEDGLDKVEQGITTLDEVLRETRASD